MRNDVDQKPWYSSYVLLIVGLVSILNYYDRHLLTILIEPIKRDLGITDSQIGLLAGIGFALMYSILGVPMARLADRFGRARVLAGVLALWSAMTAVSGATVNFTTMLLARAGVGVGEAGGLPAAHALIADYFSPRRRGLALSILGCCGAAGMSLAMLGGGMINDALGWRAAFYIAAIPGLLMAAIVYFTVREPRAKSSDGVAAIPPLGGAFKILWRRRAFVYLCIGTGIAAIGVYGQSAWTPAFLMRTYSLSASQTGAYYSAVVGPAMIVSVLVGGVINDWLVRRDPRWPLWLLAFCFASLVPASLAFFLVDNLSLALSLAVVTTILNGLWVGPAYALVQNLAGPLLRALAAAVFMMIANIIGLGLGPVVTGVLSDALMNQFGDRSLMAALCIVTMACAVAVVPLLLATRRLAADVAEANPVEASPGV